MRRTLVRCCLILIAIAGWWIPTVLAASAGAAPSSTPVGTLAQDAAQSPEEQLVQRYAPIIGLKTQDAACDENGEPFFPVSVDVVLGNDTVALKKTISSKSSTDEIVVMGPTASDLYGKGDGYYLDLPGNPRHPGCVYEQWFDTNDAGFEPMTYAHIVANGTSQLAIQYWFYYVFNDFNNTHESDWEMMQVLFDVGTVEEALNTSPVSVAIAQHGGGETADWDDSKLQRDGDRPIVFAASGSHATQYGNAVYLGWGSNGTGFGCDITTTPSTMMPLSVTLLPDTEPDPAGEFAWLNYTGRWGERQDGEYNGPTGPATKQQWTSPFLWQEGLRDSSIEVPLATTFGPAPTSAFCALSAAGSSLFRLIGDNTALFLTVVVVILSFIVSMVRYAWPTLRAAGAVYRRQLHLFLLIGLLLIPVGLLFNGFEFLVRTYPPGSTMIDLTGKSPGSYYALALLTLIGQLLASLLVVGPMVIETYDALERKQDPSFKQVVRNSLGHLPGLVKSVGLLTVTVVVLCVTVIGVPVAIWLFVRWIFVSQATVLDDVGTKEALDRSSQSVRQRWWRVATLAFCLSVIGAAPGVLVGLGLLIFGSASVQATNIVSSLIYVVTVPLTILGLTMVYRHRNLTPPFFPMLRALAGKKQPEADAGPTPAQVS